MATIDFSHFRNPVEFLIPQTKRKRNLYSKLALKSIERYRLETSEEQEKWLEHVQYILRKTFPFLENSRDLTNSQDPLNLEAFLTRTCFYRGLTVPGLIYAFNFTMPSEQALRHELPSCMPFDYRIKDSLYVKTAGRFDLELFSSQPPFPQ